MLHRIDDASLTDDETLWRRILDVPNWVTNTDNGFRPSSVAFLDGRTNEVSVSVASMTSFENLTGQYPSMGIVEIKARDAREFDHIVAKTPEVDDLSHRVICPPSDLASKGRKRIARILAERAKWKVLPESYR